MAKITAINFPVARGMCAAWQNPAVLSNVRVQQHGHPAASLPLLRRQFALSCAQFDNAMPHP
ncbi:MAG: hypothetical protein A3H31_03850 [Gallionellales bacterium RIFCSPLOWO2_02_FULL_57_47]|nr:MAG: hypothetical protein A3H31_03850 [Gallionellales bacterium RIFCSPLOWO2_02_FULL_57_47]